MIACLQKRSATILGVLVFMLVAKYLYPYFVYDIPLGYDPGIYRYLFERYAQSLQDFSMPHLGNWAKEYPPGLFVLYSPLLIAGVPVDFIIGLMWNLTPVALLLLLAWITSRRTNAQTGLALLFIGFVSQVYYDGFFGMYYKVFVSLFFLILTYHFAERMSPWMLLTAFATVMIHQQSGLILALSLSIWWVLQFKTQWKTNKHYRLISISGVLLVGCVLVLYIPQFASAVWGPLNALFARGDDIPAGTFPDTLFYLRTTGIVLALGIVGFIRSLQKERGSLWQIAVLVCLVFIVFRLVFYRRFFLQLDFFLMPFAAAGLLWIIEVSKGKKIQLALIAALLVSQIYISWQAMQLRRPRYSFAELQGIQRLETFVPLTTPIIALENVSGTWLRGWLPDHTIGGPGLFDFPAWKYHHWEVFIDGSYEEREKLLRGFKSNVYFLLTPTFSGYYGDRAQGVLTDPCLEPVEEMPLLRNICIHQPK